MIVEMIKRLDQWLQEEPLPEPSGSDDEEVRAAVERIEEGDR